MEMRRFLKLLGISYRDHITKEVKTRLGNAIGSSEDLLTSVKRRKVRRYGRVTPRLFYREQYEVEDEEEHRENDGKTTSESGLALNGTSHCGKLRTARSGGGSM